MPTVTKVGFGAPWKRAHHRAARCRLAAREFGRKIVTRFRVRVLALVLALSGGTSPVAAQGLPGDPTRGREIALEWCSECHEVMASVREPSVTGAPPFQAVADDPAVTETALRAFLQTPHTAMPDIRPTPQQTDDLIAYILTLKGRRPGT